MNRDQPSPRTGHTDAPSEGDEIGYRKPPKRSRFKPGISGNPKGRPKGAKSRASFVEQIANEIHFVKEKGRKKGYTTVELVIVTLRNLALKGDIRAGRLYEDVISKHYPQAIPTRGGFFVFPEQLSMEESLIELAKLPVYQANVEEQWERYQKERAQKSEIS